MKLEVALNERRVEVQHVKRSHKYQKKDSRYFLIFPWFARSRMSPKIIAEIYNIILVLLVSVDYIEIRGSNHPPIFQFLLFFRSMSNPYRVALGDPSSSDLYPVCF